MPLDERDYDELADDFIAAEKALRRNDPKAFRRKPVEPRIVLKAISLAILIVGMLVMTHGCRCFGPCC